MWETLLAVVVGGLLALSGTWLIEERKEKAEEKRRRAGKLEELVAAAPEHKHGLGRMERHRLFQEASPDELSPLAKLEAIAVAHFPQFLPLLSSLEEATSRYEIWMLEKAEKTGASGTGRH